MLVRHATPARNLNSILRGGLLCSKCQGKLPVVWVCSPARSSWAVLHVIRRHGGRVESTVVLEVDVPRSWLRRSRKGLWFCPRDRCQGTRTVTRLRDTNCYEPNRQPRNARGHLPYVP